MSKSSKSKRPRVGPYQPVFRGTIFTIEQAKVVLPTGKRTIFEQARRTGTVSIMALDARGRLLLLREYMDDQQAYQWTLPAGRLDNNERPLIGAQRELREETGYRAKKLKLFYVGTTIRTLKWDRYTYLATGLIKDPLPHDDGEDIIVVPTPLKKAHEMALKGIIKSEANCYLIMKLYLERKKYLKGL